MCVCHPSPEVSHSTVSMSQQDCASSDLTCLDPGIETCWTLAKVNWKTITVHTPHNSDPGMDGHFRKGGQERTYETHLPPLCLFKRVYPRAL